LAAFEYGSPEGIYDLSPHGTCTIILTLSLDLGSHWAAQRKPSRAIDYEDRQSQYNIYTTSTCFNMIHLHSIIKQYVFVHVAMRI
jgi:hypothetical protein